MPKAINLEGQKIGRWTVITHIRGSSPSMWKCKCDCGTERDVNAQSLRNGITHSCGCFSREVTAKRNLIHGFARRGEVRDEYICFCSLRSRCNNPNDPAYKRYGALGIKVHPEWDCEGGFQLFYEHIGPRPTPQHSIDRIDGSKGYVPGNVQWATKKEQALNRKTTRWLTHEGLTLSLKDWAEKKGIARKTLSLRLDSGWDFARAINTPVNLKHSRTFHAQRKKEEGQIDQPPL